MSKKLSRLLDMRQKSEKSAIDRRLAKRLDDQISAEAEAFVSEHQAAGDPLGILRAISERTKMDMPLSLSERIKAGHFKPKSS